jgi:hypothetical protein
MRMVLELTIGSIARIFNFRRGHRPEQDAPRCWVNKPGRAEKLKRAGKEPVRCRCLREGLAKGP